MLWVTVKLTAISLLLTLGAPLQALAGYGAVEREWRQEMGEVRDARRRAIREIMDADSPAEFRREIREGRREVRREIREMRREVRREIRREIRRDNRRYR